jgi:hypothetical protein
MSNSSNPEDSSNRDAILSFVIQSLKEHQQVLDKLIEKLLGLGPHIDDFNKIFNRFEEIEVKVDELDKEIKHLNSLISGPVK